MKKVKFIILAVIILLGITIVGCKKDNDTNPDIGKGTMTAKIDGKNFSSTSEASARYIEGVLLISGVSKTGQIQLSVYNTTKATGNFQIADGSTNMGIYIHSKDVNENYYSYVDNGTGNIKIIEFTGNDVKGTFHFTAGNINGGSVNITDGTFDVKIIATDISYN
ncbi:hypothetical protein SAMN06265379_102413 [Saccharicrinis carchari]|uniref:Uncharacterized protein n=1 Tax=Saccharicrinis carchari TaxID=1168039 RepID=A0A521C655_SACCC|nr:DUF6252 family protein [Saccharicrinis carchari]SMO54845.1 hypothetical protein SAMN06265379_102413 [Saccharicrinis carchari]